jgi:hypothetical protein
VTGAQSNVEKKNFEKVKNAFLIIIIIIQINHNQIKGLK